MIQSPYFWIVLAASAGAYWALPSRWRLGFLALVSGGYVFALSPLNALALLAWALLFYALAPLSCRRAPVNVRRSFAREPALAAVGHGDGDGAAISPVPLTAEVAGRPAPPARNRRWVMWVLICGILGYLACFKYIVPYALERSARGGGGGDAAGRYLIPLGVSYFTFKFIHYAVESARGNVTDRSLTSFLCYMFLFPTFSAGPIERYDHFLAHRESRWEARMLVEGLTRIICGLVKKLVLGEMLLGSIFRTDLFEYGGKPLREVTTLSLWGTAIVSYLFVYLDFSGYSDVAIGASRLFGLRIMENFAFPFLAPNVAEFWKRWHMTLAGWCQAYVYMPVLGVWRRPVVATFASFVAIGLWHSASIPWVFWGLYHAAGILVYQRWAKLKRARKWKWTDRWPARIGGIVITTLFVSAGALITFGGVQNGRQAMRVLGKLLFVNWG